jgi:phage-related minor tail protein
MTDPKGKMQDKWLRIAAGAFNAAQKGSPTLLGGLADLGGGVTEQLLAFNADEQKQAQELFTLYTAREELKRTAITTASDQRQQDIENLQKATTAHNNELARLLDELELSGYTTEEAESMVAIGYADAGVKTAQYNYARGIKQINNKRAELETKHTSEDTGILNRQDFLNEFDEFLRKNKHLARYYDNYRDRETAVEDWLLPMLDKI